MALTEEKIIDRIEILDNGILQIREAHIIKRDGVEIGKSYTRKVIDVDEDVTSEDSRIKAVGDAVWDTTTKSKRLAQVNEQRVKEGLPAAASMAEVHGRI